MKVGRIHLKKILLGAVFLISLQTSIHAQTPGIEWQETIGGWGVDNYYPWDSSANGYNNNLEKCKMNYSGGGYFLLSNIDFWGSPDSPYYSFYKGMHTDDGSTSGLVHATDMLLLRLNENREVVWKRFLGGSSDEYAREAIETSDKGFAVVGRTLSPNNGDVYGQHGLGDGWIVKLDENGVLQWQKCLGGSKLDEVLSVKQTNDLGYILLCYAESTNGDVQTGAGFWLVKLDNTGSIEWQKTLCGGDKNHKGDFTRNEGFLDMTSDGGYIITANDENPVTHDQDLIVIKTDKNGNEQFKKILGGTGYEKGRVVQELPAGAGYIIAAKTNSTDKDVLDNHGNSDAWVIKLDNKGNIKWKKCFGGSKDDVASDIKLMQDGSYIIAGYTLSNDGDVKGNHDHTGHVQDAWVFQIDSSANLIWQKCYGGTALDGYFNTGWDGIFSIGGNENEILLLGIVNSTNGDITNSDVYYNIWFLKLGETNTVKGSAYYDSNLNGIKDESEKYYSNARINIEKGNFKSSVVSIDGIFSTDVDTGTFIVNAVPYNQYYNVAPVNTPVTFNSYYNTDSLSFAIQPIPNKKDLFITNIPVMPARLGFDAFYKINYQNVGTTTLSNGHVQLIKDSKLTILYTEPVYSTINGDTLVWDNINLNPTDTASIIVYYNLPVANASIGDTLHSLVTINPVENDLTPQDDSAYLAQVVRSSFDPNDKTENHGGSISKNKVASGEYLTYLVRFQNSGTDTAFNIVIRDTLDDKLDWNTLQMTGASHNCQLTIKDGNKCAWNFDNILLPDSNTNKAASHGYIVYRIKPKTSLSTGDIISNTASIYFDYNLPVQTNTEKTTVSNDALLPLQLIAFAANHSGKTNLLQWSTSQEINTDRFEVQHSNNSRDFTVIGTVKTLNNGKAKNDYTFTDEQPIKAINYYRLRMIDKDGKVSLSPVRSINNQGSFDCSLYPNPAKNNLTISFSSEKKIDIQVKILNAEGKIVLLQKMQIAAGNSTKNINVSSLGAGNYFLNCISQDGQIALRFIKN